MIAVPLSLLLVACAPYETIEAAGVSRRFVLDEPSSLADPPTVLLAFHGGGGNARQMRRYTDLTPVGEERGFVIVYPDSVNGHWVTGRTAPAIEEEIEGVDDLAFVEALVAEMTRRYGVQPGHFWATGISNGGMFSLRLACEPTGSLPPGTFGGIAVVAASLPTDIAETCAPGAPLSLWQVHGTDDSYVPYEGGYVMDDPDWGSVIAVEDTRDLFVRQDGCTGDPTVESWDEKRDGTSVEQQSWTDCQEGTSVSFHRVDGGGHSWPGARGAFYLGTTSREMDASEEIGAWLVGR
jgi:polyhydroxybutyrate depolymerase